MCYLRGKPAITSNSDSECVKVIESDTSEFVRCRFLLLINCNRDRNSHRFRDIAFGRPTSEMALSCYPLALNASGKEVLLRRPP